MDRGGYPAGERGAAWLFQVLDAASRAGIPRDPGAFSVLVAVALAEARLAYCRPPDFWRSQLAAAAGYSCGKRLGAAVERLKLSGWIVEAPAPRGRPAPMWSAIGGEYPPASQAAGSRPPGAPVEVSDDPGPPESAREAIRDPEGVPAPAVSAAPPEAPGDSTRQNAGSRDGEMPAQTGSTRQNAGSRDGEIPARTARPGEMPARSTRQNTGSNDSTRQNAGSRPGILPAQGDSTRQNTGYPNTTTTKEEEREEEEAAEEGSGESRIEREARRRREQERRAMEGAEAAILAAGLQNRFVGPIRAAFVAYISRRFLPAAKGGKPSALSIQASARAIQDLAGKGLDERNIVAFVEMAAERQWQGLNARWFDNHAEEVAARSGVPIDPAVTAAPPAANDPFGVGEYEAQKRGPFKR